MLEHILLIRRFDAWVQMIKSRYVQIENLIASSCYSSRNKININRLNIYLYRSFSDRLFSSKFKCISFIISMSLHHDSDFDFNLLRYYCNYNKYPLFHYSFAYCYNNRKNIGIKYDWVIMTSTEKVNNTGFADQGLKAVKETEMIWEITFHNFTIRILRFHNLTNVLV